MDKLGESIERLAAETGFSGVVRVDGRDGVRFAKAFGFAHRGYGVANTVDTRFAIASGTKGLTALTVVSLIEDGLLEYGTTARSVLGDDLPLIDDAVTVEQLLTHRSGIGDFYPDDHGGSVNDYVVLPAEVRDLDSTEHYLRVLDGHPMTSAPGEKFCYNNGGFAVLAIIAGRAGGAPFPELVARRVCGPAGMTDTEFLRSDEPRAGVALGYLEADGLRTHVFHLSVQGSGDGGIYSTAADVHALWAAFTAGRIVPPARVAEMVSPVSDVPEELLRYGRGLWLHESDDSVVLMGFDPGVSFQSVHDPVAGYTHTVLSNTSHGVWPLTRHLGELLRQ
jgi:CubicO group peptidase (beta-lactamase class C family)